jgi:hypothetical protein
MPAKPETKFVKQLRSDLESIPGVWILKTQERGRRGVPDLIICIKGDFVAIEAKIDGKVPDKLQELTLERIRKSGGLAFYTTPSDWPKYFGMIQKLYAK